MHEDADKNFEFTNPVTLSIPLHADIV